jgi:hypothetical protein
MFNSLPSITDGNPVDWESLFDATSPEADATPESHQGGFKLAPFKPRKKPKPEYKRFVEPENPLEIKPFATSKSKIKNNPYQDSLIIPKHPFACILNGRSGSGKSQLLVNLMARDQFFCNYFDIVFLVSPTAGTMDDLCQHLNLPVKRIINILDPKTITKIMGIQEDLINKNGIDKSPKLLIIYDDCQSNEKFLRSKPVIQSFIAGRHYNMSVFLCSQSWTRTQRVCRLQCSNVMFFPGTESEVDLLTNEFCPPNTTKAQFRRLIKHATAQNFNFLHINMKAPVAERYRKNLDTMLSIS